MWCTGERLGIVARTIPNTETKPWTHGSSPGTPQKSWSRPSSPERLPSSFSDQAYEVMLVPFNRKQVKATIHCLGGQQVGEVPEPLTPCGAASRRGPRERRVSSQGAHEKARLGSFPIDFGYTCLGPVDNLLGNLGSGRPSSFSPYVPPPFNGFLQARFLHEPPKAEPPPQAILDSPDLDLRWCSSRQTLRFYGGPWNIQLWRKVLFITPSHGPWKL